MVVRNLDGVERAYQRCVSCVMDTDDPEINFDEDGVCDYCLNFRTHILPSWCTDERGAAQLEQLSERIRAESKGRDFDCIIGLSGGLDSSYAAYTAVRRMNLRPLLFHVDAGWNTDQASGNIEKLVDGLGVDLYTEVINWEEVKDLQLAFLRSQIPDQDHVQDTAFFSSLYRFARRHRIKHVLTGANYSTESCREPEAWGAYPGIDRRLIRDIHRRFGERPLKTFPIVDITVYRGLYQGVLGMEVVRPLNHMPFVKAEAENELAREFGWESFQHKHHESRFTRFFEDFWLPGKFGFHKRKAHFSSLILSDQMDREVAIERLKSPEMDQETTRQETRYVASKLGISTEELMALFDGPNRTWRDYRNKHWLITLGTLATRRVGNEKRLFR